MYKRAAGPRPAARLLFSSAVTKCAAPAARRGRTVRGG